MIESFALLTMASLWQSMFGGTTKFSTSPSVVPVQGNSFGYIVSSIPSVAAATLYGYANTQYSQQIASVSKTGSLHYSATTTIPSQNIVYAKGVASVQPYPNSGYVSVPYTIQWVQTATSMGYVAVQAK